MAEWEEIDLFCRRQKLDIVEGALGLASELEILALILISWEILREMASPSIHLNIISQIYHMG